MLTKSITIQNAVKSNFINEVMDEYSDLFPTSNL